MHTCDNPPCVNPNHLIQGSDADNMRDKTLKGRAAIKLTAEDVRAIRAAPRGSKAMADEYGISYVHLKHIRSGKVWKWLDDHSR